MLEKLNTLRATKKSVSPVIATIMLVLVTFMAVVIVVGIIRPMVRENLERGKTCFELRDYVSIVDSEYTCYNFTHTQLMIERGMEDVEIKGFAVGLFSGGSSERYDLEEGNFPAGVSMIGGNIKLPESGEAKTYIFEIGNTTLAEIAVIQKNKNICNAVSYSIPRCSSQI
jgi:flagellin-like protein